jgi:hypothetical protein
MTRIVRANSYWKIEGTIVAQTEKAVCITIKTLQDCPINSAVSSWFPRSQIENLALGGEGELDSFEASQWILEQKGFKHDLERITAAPQRVVRETFDAPAEEYLPKESERRSFKVKEFDEYDDDIPF